MTTARRRLDTDDRLVAFCPECEPSRVRRLGTVLAVSALLGLLLGTDVSAAAGGSAKSGRPQATLSVSISSANKGRVVGIARCRNSPLRHGVRGAIAFNDGSNQSVKSSTTRLSHTYRYSPPYSVTLTCRGTNGRVASKSVTVDISP
jgi:hypothetical protein